jgi:hypothetical protein
MIAPCWRLVVIESVVALEKVNVPLNGTSGVVALILDGWTTAVGENVPVMVTNEFAAAIAALDARRADGSTT